MGTQTTSGKVGGSSNGAAPTAVTSGARKDSVSIPLKRRAAVRPVAATQEESAVTTAARLPRITRLLALAVRFEGLLQEGTVRDYAELARLAAARTHA